MRKSYRGGGLFRAETLLLILFAASLAAALPARADDDDDDNPGFLDRMGNSISRSMDGARAKVGLAPKPDAPPPAESPSGCPSIAILDGTTAQRVMVSGGQGNQGVRHQFSLQDVGRRCTNAGGRLGIKVAADGKVLLGPAGAAGSFAVPVRVVVFDERQQKPTVSKLYQVPASVASGQTTAPFQFVSDDIVVPASANPARDYSIKIGIDMGKGGDGGVAKKGRRRKPTGADSASR